MQLNFSRNSRRTPSPPAKTGRSGYTLVEILIVIALLATLSAMLFPVFARVQEKTRQSACASNLRQIGSAISLYATDYDGFYPYGADPSDKYTRVWGVDPKQDNILRNMPLLLSVLSPYTKNKPIWKCPSDTGLDDVEWSLGETEQRTKGVKPSLYAAFGSSYFYRTELAFGHKLVDTSVVDSQHPHQSLGTSALVIMNDASGQWHGDGKDIEEQFFNSLFADGHVKRQSFPQNRQSWALKLE